MAPVHPREAANIKAVTPGSKRAELVRPVENRPKPKRKIVSQCANQHFLGAMLVLGSVHYSGLWYLDGGIYLFLIFVRVCTCIYLC